MPLLAAGTNNKYVTVNEALVRADSLIPGVVNTCSLAQPAGGETEGSVHILGGTGAGDWTGAGEGDLAILTAGGWTFLTPLNGWTFYCIESDATLRYDADASSPEWIEVDFAPAQLSDVGDVSSTTPTDGQVLTWDDTAGEWHPSSTATTVLAGLDDVASTTPTDGQVLTWDDTAGEWVPDDAQAASLAELSDVGDVSSATPTDGQVLTWSSSAGEWAPEDPQSSGGGEGTPRVVTSNDDVLASDFGTRSLVEANSSSTITLTVPAGLSVEVGQKAVLYQAGSGQLVVAEETGVALDTPETLKAAKQHAQLVLTCTGTDAYVLGGYMETA